MRYYLILLILLLLPVAAGASNYKFEWTANSEPVDGYTLFWGALAGDTLNFPYFDTFTVVKVKAWLRTEI